jgi:hypothetical protein
MATIIKCTACGSDVSDAAKACPKCGQPVKRPSSFGKLFLVVGSLAIVGIVISAVISKNEPAPAPQTAAEARAEQVQNRGLSLALEGAQSLKKGARNPDSFKLESAFVVSATNDVCFEYRAQNGFGGMSRERAVFVGMTETLIPQGADGFQHAWKAECAGKPGHEDGSFIASRM